MCRASNVPYGIARGDHYEPARRGPLSETVWDSEPYLAVVPQLFERLRRELGSTGALLHDAHHRLTPIEAARFGRALEPYHLFWLEDPTPADNPEVFRLFRQHTTTPLAVGESVQLHSRLPSADQEQLIDYIRTSVVHAGGITHMRKIAALAELHGVRTGSHGATDLSPVCLAAALHFDLHVPNFGIQEYMPHSADTDRVFPHAYRFDGGLMHPGDAPGLGVELDEAARRRLSLRARLAAGGAAPGRHGSRLVR